MIYLHGFTLVYLIVDNYNNDVFLCRWFHPNLNRHQTEALLLHNGQDGSYLLRSSTSKVGEYSLSVKCANSVKHFQIGWNGENYIFGMGKFSNIEDFVSHFENKPLIGGETGKKLRPSLEGIVKLFVFNSLTSYFWLSVLFLVLSYAVLQLYLLMCC